MEQSNIDTLHEEMVEIEERLAIVKQDIEYYGDKLEKSKTERAIASYKWIISTGHETILADEIRLNDIKDLLKIGG